MDKIIWCISNNHGISLVEPSIDLANAYLLKSKISLRTITEVSDTAWKITAAYYSLYFSLYAVIIRIGIKCEIHDCTIEFMKQFLKEYYSIADINMIIDAKNNRIDMQYYTGKNIDNTLLEKDIIENFYEKSENIIQSLTKADISNVRSALQLFQCQK